MQTNINFLIGGAESAIKGETPMKKFVFVIVIAMLTIGCGINTVTVRIEQADDFATVSTGWYNEKGEIITTAHKHVTDENKRPSGEIEVSNGYTDEVTFNRSVAYDTVAFKPSNKYSSSRCYASPKKGDRVSVWHNNGWHRTNITSVGEITFKIADKDRLEEGDSGSPVTIGIKGCVLGVVRSRNTVDRTIEVVRLDTEN